MHLCTGSIAKKSLLKCNAYNTLNMKKKKMKKARKRATWKTLFRNKKKEEKS